MAKPKQMEVIGWYQPHIAVDWDGMVPDPKTGELVKEPSMTKQSFKDECDINTIVKRIEAPGMMDLLHQQTLAGRYEDLPDQFDYQSAIEVSRQAGEAFMSLPAAARARFQNNPAEFLAFMADPANQEEAIKLGLAVDKRNVEPPPMKVEVINGSKDPPQDPPK